jgi:hypothetical protein
MTPRTEADDVIGFITSAVGLKDDVMGGDVVWARKAEEVRRNLPPTSPITPG